MRRFSGGRRSLLVTVAVLAVLGATTTACRPAVAGARCRVGAGEWGSDGAWVLRCVRGRWTKVVGVAEARRLEAASRLQASLPNRPPAGFAGGVLVPTRTRTGLHEREWTYWTAERSAPVVCEQVLDGLLAAGFGRVDDCRDDATAGRPWQVRFEQPYLVGLVTAARPGRGGTEVVLRVAACGPGTAGARDAAVASTLPLCRRAPHAPGEVADPAAADRVRRSGEAMGAPSHRDVPYGPDLGCDGPLGDGSCGGSQEYDVYPPLAGTPRGTLVWVHGGGFVAGDKVDRYADGLLVELRHRGWAVVRVNYRLVVDGAPAFPAQVDDVVAALAHLRANAASLGVDDAHVVLGGYSAGGNLAALVGAAARGPRPPGSPVPPVEVSAWLSVAGLLDVTAGPATLRGVDAALGADRSPARRTAASPAAYLDATDVPGYVVQGDRDLYVEVGNAHRTSLAARRAGLVPRTRVDVVDVDARGTELPVSARNHLPFAGLHLTALASWLEEVTPPLAPV